MQTTHDPNPRPRGTASRVARGLVGGLVTGGARLYGTALTQTVKSWQYSTWTSMRLMEGNVLPTMEALADIQRGVSDQVAGVARGETTVRDFVRELGDRAWSAARWSSLVRTVGKEVYGSARWDGEEVLGEHGPFRLTYIPAAGGRSATKMAIFHAGGAIPYGDGIFRLTPHHNLFGRFVERDVAVYAMELKGDRLTCDYGDLTIERLTEALDRLSDLAFDHHGRRLVLEGYCGHGTQALPLLCARTEAVARKFRAFASFVSPFDGTRCERIAASVQRAPDGLLATHYALWDKLGGGYVPGDPARVGLDLALGAVFHKTRLGYLTAGWTNHGTGLARGVEDLSPSGMRDLAGAYWISPDAARRWPIPVGIARYTTPLFVEGVGRDGTLPYDGPDGRRLSLQRVVDETDLQLFGFYGGLDTVVPDATGHVLIDLFGDRYTHVVHPHAGHISYVLSPRSWKAGGRRSFSPDPIDLLLASEPGAKD